MKKKKKKESVSYQRKKILLYAVQKTYLKLGVVAHA